MNKILIIQTSFLGDVILATSLVESLKSAFANAEIHMLVRKGNEGLIHSNPQLKKVWIWDKKEGKYSSLIKLGKAIRNENFDLVVNPHRYASSGLIALMSGAKTKVGFKKNPLSFTYTKSFDHRFDGQHEIERNHQLIAEIVGMKSPEKPKIYPTKEDQEAVEKYVTGSFVCMAPTSVWFTKQWPAERWIELTNKIPPTQAVYMLGAPADAAICASIKAKSKHQNITVLAGKLSLMQSAALMHKAKMNYVNDSGPMHLASATNAPVSAIFCSTVLSFGFGPLSDQSFVLELEENLDCRPCGIHGHQVCPKGHFKCGNLLTAEQVYHTES
ncbi:MAG: glycosyltransferase family 9 protein [Salibacteraceae bacterium]|nr:glycosyltransferase family 9 protein [Salibacteraceae bacterium]